MLDRSSPCIRLSARVARTQEKFGPAVAVPRKSEIHCIQLPGWARKSCGAAWTRSAPHVMGRVSSPTSPMSWYSGSHEMATSWAGSIWPASKMASRFEPSTRSGSMTPLGSDVDPLVYCRITSRSGSGSGISMRSGPGLRGPGSTSSSSAMGGSPGCSS